MAFFKNFFKTLTVGKILTLAAAVFMIIAAALHITNQYADPYHPIFDMGAFFALLFGGIGSIVLLFFFNGKYAGIPALAGSAIGLAFFATECWIYVSDAFYGVDATWTAPFFLSAVPMALALALSLVGFFVLKPVKNPAPKAIVGVTAVLFPILLAGGTITQDPSARVQINKAFNTSDTIRETIGDDTQTDTQYFKSRYNDIPELLSAGQKQCEEVAAEGFVLLKNNGALPLNSGAKASLFSVSTADPVYGGTGSGSVDTSSAPNLKAALEHNNNLSVNPTLWDYYATGDGAAYRRTKGSVGAGVTGPRSIGDAPWAEVDAANGSTFAAYGDAAIMVISRVGGEGSDSPRSTYSLNQLVDVDGTGGDSTSGEYLTLSPKEKGILHGLKAKKESGVFQKVIVVLNFANQVEADFIEKEEFGIDAAIWIGTPGSYGFNALSDILVGKVNPSGRLSATFWASHHQNPALSNFGPKLYEGSPDPYVDDKGSLNQDRVYTVYQEGIYVGYRYVESRYEDYVVSKEKVGDFSYKNAVSYPFGFGLSYTNFEYTNFSVDKDGRGDKTTYTVKVDVKNSGTVAGKDVVEVYLDKPYNQYCVENGVENSASELVGFAKTSLLQPGATEKVEIVISERQFASYDAKKAGTYVITGGDYYLSVGHDAHDAINNALAAKGNSPASSNNRMDATGLASHAHKVSLDFDSVSYATNVSTHAPIKNLFQDCDYNNYEHRVAGDEVKYVSRSDWNGTVKLNWNDHVVLHFNDKLQDDLDKYGREGEVKLPEDARVYPTMGKGGELQLISLRQDEEGNPIDYNDPIWDEYLDQMTWDEMANCIRSGMRSSGAIANYGKPQNVDQNGPNGCTERFSTNKNTKVGLFWTKYDENSPEAKMRPTCYPSAGVRASTWNQDLSFATGNMIADDALWVGYNGLYGPGSNIQRTPYLGRNYEYYSEDGYLSGVICAYETNAMENRGLYVFNKHFGLNEVEDMRRGVQTWANEQTIREIYLRAFELPVTMKGTTYVYEGQPIVFRGAAGVMIAMNRVGLYWTGLRKGFMTDYLRDEIGMTGIAVTDMWFGKGTPYLNFAAMLAAGTNLIDGSRYLEDIEAAKTGHADVAWGLREAVHRICYTTVHSNAMNGYSSNIRLRHVRVFWEDLILGLQIATGILLAGGLAWGVVVSIREHKKKVD